LAVASALSGHLGAAERILRDRQFDLRGLRNLLDVGSGAGQIAAPLLRYADSDAQITCSDFSTAMLQRARTKLESDWPRFVVADLSHLPFADGSFDGITCGYVLEHLPRPEPGLQELARVLAPGGRLLLMTMEDNFFGKLTSRTWHCRTHNREELKQACELAGLEWRHEIQVPRWHQMPWIGGICVELQRPPAARYRPLRHTRWTARDFHMQGDQPWRP
jgi:ubiquinone/menaquinone biosynthesis C-methylase UbiE